MAMQLFNLRRRLTRRYVGTYAHLDAWVSLGTAKDLGTPKLVHCRYSEEHYDPSMGDTYGFTVAVGPGIMRTHGPREIERALRDTFSRHGCAHTYDCCGCASHYAEAKHTRGREFWVTIETSYNY